MNPVNPEIHSPDPVIATVLQNPAEDKTHAAHEQPHDQATEVAHAWQHFWENARVFACFFGVVLLTVIAWNVNFGPRGNEIAVFFFAAARSGLIAYFMLSLFKTFSLVRSTFIFCAIFLAGMIFLSWWDSELRGIGNPIKDKVHPESANLNF
jgi:lipopolysaccharide export LptBFGC system permease protein LptF